MAFVRALKEHIEIKSTLELRENFDINEDDSKRKL